MIFLNLLWVRYCGETVMVVLEKVFVRWLIERVSEKSEWVVIFCEWMWERVNWLLGSEVGGKWRERCGERVWVSMSGVLFYFFSFFVACERERREKRGVSEREEILEIYYSFPTKKSRKILLVAVGNGWAVNLQDKKNPMLSIYIYLKSENYKVFSNYIKK